MARTRRKMRKAPGRARRPRADWVFRTDLVDPEGALNDGLGTYVFREKSLGVGTDAARAVILYDSHNRMFATAAGGVSNLPFAMPRASRAEGGKAFIHRVQGTIFVRPSAWTLGDRFRLGLRFGVYEQDPDTGTILIDPSYTMWHDPGNMQLSTAVWANDRNWQHERRFGTTFSDNAQMWTLPVAFSVRRSLQPHQCYAIWMESFNAGAPSTTLLLQFWLRSLVSDEG